MQICNRSLGRAAFIAALSLTFLTACEPSTGVDRSLLADSALAAIPVAQTKVAVGAPAGYCVDKKASRDRKSGTFVILGSCATLKGGKASGPTNPAVLTATISPEADLPQVPTARQLEQFFRSNAGRAALAHDNQASKVTLLEIKQRGDMLILKVRDTSASRPDDLRDTSWRVVFGLKGRLVALAVHSHDALPMGDAEMRRTLDRFIAAMQAVNPNPKAAGKT